MPPTPCDTFPAAATTALKMAPRTRPSPEIVEDVVVCAPLIAPTSTVTARPPREIPCIGCLILLVNWIPEDGKPFPCSDPESRLQVPVAISFQGPFLLTAYPVVRKDGKCLRCVRRSKSCEKPCVEDAIKNARELASLLSEHSPNLVSRRPDSSPQIVRPRLHEHSLVLTVMMWEVLDRTRPGRD